MLDTQACEWLMENADAPIRYRVAREFLNNANEDNEKELLENHVVQLWLKKLKPQTPPQHWRMIHGSFDYNLENALLKVVQLGLHAGLEPVQDAIKYYIVSKDADGAASHLSLLGISEIMELIKELPVNFMGLWPLNFEHDPALDKFCIPDGTSIYGLFDENYTKYTIPKALTGLTQVSALSELKPDCWCLLEASSGFNYIASIVEDPSKVKMKTITTLEYVLTRLEDCYRFVSQKSYDIYMSSEERSKLKKIPNNWKNSVHFIKRELTFCYPSIYDIVSLHKLYDLKDSEINKKIDAIIEYITNDDYNSKIADGYGIVIVDGRYYSMGWDAKYPGWFDLSAYMETGNVSKLLFFAEYISKYPFAVKTKWFSSLLDYLETYKTENGTYIFPAEWLKESTGYAVLGHHVSFGENRRKKNWREIESTFYMQLLKQNLECLV